MRTLLQRVTAGSVYVGDRQVAAIGPGLVLLVGIGRDDTLPVVRKQAEKVVRLRLFADPTGKMNLSLTDTGRAVLAVSQFTLYADVKKGRRPSFTQAAPPDRAEPLFEAFVAHLRNLGVHPVATGVFGATMAVRIHNDGPVTLWLDSDQMYPPAPGHPPAPPTTPPDPPGSHTSLTSPPSGPILGRPCRSCD